MIVVSPNENLKRFDNGRSVAAMRTRLKAKALILRASLGAKCVNDIKKRQPWSHSVGILKQFHSDNKRLRGRVLYLFILCEVEKWLVGGRRRAYPDASRFY